MQKVCKNFRPVVSRLPANTMPIHNSQNWGCTQGSHYKVEFHTWYVLNRPGILYNQDFLLMEALAEGKLLNSMHPEELVYMERNVIMWRCMGTLWRSCPFQCFANIWSLCSFGDCTVAFPALIVALFFTKSFAVVNSLMKAYFWTLRCHRYCACHLFWGVCGTVLVHFSSREHLLDVVFVQVCDALRLHLLVNIFVALSSLWVPV